MWNSMNFFFFQAEDGIRDKLATGVQTCALPILVVARREVQPAAVSCHRGLCVIAIVDDLVEVNGRRELPRLGLLAAWRFLRQHGWRPERSEERRVGKECRSRWSP